MMSNDPDTSDDLIAELAKLMAQDAQAPEEAHPPAPMNAPRARSVPLRAEPRAVGVSQRAAAESVPLDFDRPGAAADIEVPQAFAHQGERVTPLIAEDAELGHDTPLGPVPRFFAPDAAHPTQAARFVGDRPAGARENITVAVEPVRASADLTAEEERDAIADLIAAELGVSYAREPEHVVAAPESRVELTASAPAAPAPVVLNEPDAEVASETSARQETPSRVANTVRAFTPATVAATDHNHAVRVPQRQAQIAPQPRSVPVQAETRAPEQSKPAQPAVNVAPAVASVAPESDDFTIAPVFGLGGRTTTPTPRVESVQPQKIAAEQPRRRDPIDEIESLIGEAVRVQVPAAPTAPVLAKSDKRRIEPKAAAARLERSSQNAEDAILAAAAVNGMDLGGVEAEGRFARETEEADFVPAKARRRFSMRPIIAPLVAATLLAGAGFGLYSVVGVTGGTNGEAPVLTAEAGTIKEDIVAIPSASAGQRSAVFDEIQGVASPETEQLVAREEVVDTVDPVVTADISEEGLANRKVRTVTVRPDGTIVNNDTALAASELLPVDRPNVPDLPSAGNGGTSLLAGLSGAQGGVNALIGDPQPGAAESAITDAAGTQLGNSAAPDMTALAPQSSALTTEVAQPVNPGPPVAVDMTGRVLDGVEVPVPMPRLSRGGSAALETNQDISGAPSGAISTVNALMANPDTSSALPANGVASAPVQQAQPVSLRGSTQVAPIEQPAAAPAASNAAAYVQLSSQRTEADANASSRQLTNRFSSLFDGGALQVQKTDLGQRGTFYRVRLPAVSLASAKQICTKIKAAGGDCIVS